MKIFFILMISFTAFQASADLDCDIKTSLGEKKTESKAVFKMVRDGKDITSYEAVAEGYTFKADIHKPTSPKDKQLGIQVGILDQNSGNRTLASSDGMTPTKPEAILMAALINEKEHPAKFAKLDCHFKP